MNIMRKILNKHREIQNITIPGSDVQIEMVSIPAGDFIMGHPEIIDECEDYYAESTLHQVRLLAFWLGKHQVTQLQWETVMGNNPSRFKNPKNPVEQISWEDAVEFCKQLSAKTDKEFRLPSESEWEYACRAGTTTEYCYGDSGIDNDYYEWNSDVIPKQLGEYAWYHNNSDGKPHLVGQKRPNPWGLYDMHGNVTEWCQDWWHEDYKGAPEDGNAWEMPTSDWKVFRGGSWAMSWSECKSSFRWGSPPGGWSGRFGFRIAMNE
jgi:formylglycine-generating enzyme required for sulfatase activity